jgi:hypothetical protein
LSYEKPLTVGSMTRWPDFTVEDPVTEENIYWEHLGMLYDLGYRKGWETELGWYR